MKYLGFAVYSSVPGVSITAEMGSALLVAVRKLEHAWAGQPLMCDGPAQLLYWPGGSPIMKYPPGYVHVDVVESLPDAPQDIAYHTVTAGGDPLCLISWAAVQAEGGTITGPNGLLSAISHEVLECLVDPTCQRTVPLPDGSGNLTSVEVCDWCQGTDWAPIPGVYVASAVDPEFLSTRAVGALLLRGDPGRLSQRDRARRHRDAGLWRPSASDDSRARLSEPAFAGGMRRNVGK